MATSAGEAGKPSSSVKLVLLGEAAVGKSSLVLRFVNNDFQENKEPTIGAAFLTSRIKLPTRDIKFEIWDTAGQERFASLAPMYYRNAQAALVVYDLTKPTSLTKAKHWIAELQRQASPGIVIALVGNKLDLCAPGSGSDADTTVTDPTTESSTETHDPEQSSSTDAAAQGASADDATADDSDARKIPTREAKAYAEEEGALFFETSAKQGTNVQAVFEAIANAIPESNLKGPKTGGGAAGSREQTSLGAGGASGGRGGDDNSRINLAERARKQQENCAC